MAIPKSYRALGAALVLLAAGCSDEYRRPMTRADYNTHQVANSVEGLGRVVIADLDRDLYADLLVQRDAGKVYVKKGYEQKVDTENTIPMSEKMQEMATAALKAEGDLAWKREQEDQRHTAMILAIRTGK